MLQGGQVFEAVDEGRPRRPKPRPEGTHQEGTKKELAQRKADEEQLAAYRKEYHNCGHEWLEQNLIRNDKIERWAHAKIARLERLLRDAGGEW